jgi:hypothetical protein
MEGKVCSEDEKRMKLFQGSLPVVGFFYQWC